MFIHTSEEMPSRTADVTLITVLTTVFINNIRFQVGVHTVFVRKEILSFDSFENGQNNPIFGENFIDTFDMIAKIVFGSGKAPIYAFFLFRFWFWSCESGFYVFADLQDQLFGEPVVQK